MGRNAALLQPLEPALGAAPHPVELPLQLSMPFPQLFGPALDIGDRSSDPTEAIVDAGRRARPLSRGNTGRRRQGDRCEGQRVVRRAEPNHTTTGIGGPS